MPVSASAPVRLLCLLSPAALSLPHRRRRRLRFTCASVSQTSASSRPRPLPRSAHRLVLRFSPSLPLLSRRPRRSIRLGTAATVLTSSRALLRRHDSVATGCIHDPRSWERTSIGQLMSQLGDRVNGPASPLHPRRPCPRDSTSAVDRHERHRRISAIPWSEQARVGETAATLAQPMTRAPRMRTALVPATATPLASTQSTPRPRWQCCCPPVVEMIASPLFAAALGAPLAVAG